MIRTYAVRNPFILYADITITSYTSWEPAVADVLLFKRAEALCASFHDSGELLERALQPASYTEYRVQSSTDMNPVLSTLLERGII